MASDKHFFFQIFSKNAFANKRNISKIVRFILADLSVNGLTFITILFRETLGICIIFPF